MLAQPTAAFGRARANGSAADWPGGHNPHDVTPRLHWNGPRPEPNGRSPYDVAPTHQHWNMPGPDPVAQREEPDEDDHPAAEPKSSAAAPGADGTATKAKRWTFVKADLTLLADPELRAASKIVCLALKSHADPQGGCFPSVATLAQETGLGTTAVRRALRHLEGAGLLRTTGRRDERGQTSNLYAVLAHAAIPPTQSVGGGATQSVGVGHGTRRGAHRNPLGGPTQCVDEVEPRKEIQRSDKRAAFVELVLGGMPPMAAGEALGVSERSVQRFTADPRTRAELDSARAGRLRAFR